MKFARYLEENTVPEWKKVYIQYRGLKKLIKRVAEHRQARLAYEAQLANASAQQTPAASSLGSNESELRRRNAPQSAATTAGADNATHDSHQGSSLARSQGNRYPTNYGGTSTDNPPAIQLPPVRLNGTGLCLAGDDPDVVQDEVLSSDAETTDLEAQMRKFAPDGAPISQRRRLGSGFEPDTATVVDAGEASAEPLDRMPSSQDRPQPKQNQPPKQAHDSSKKNSKALASSASTKIKLKKIKEAYPTSLEELMSSAFDEEERKMFHACDAELEKITIFYAARELDAAHKYMQLATQLQELAEHRREYRARHKAKKAEVAIADRAKQRLSQIFGIKDTQLSKFGGRASARESYSSAKPDEPVAPEAEANRGDACDHSYTDFKAPASSLNGKARQHEEDEGDRRRAEALAKMQNSLRAWDDETDRAIRLQNKAAAMSHNPEAYYAARKKLKAAVLEYYKFLETLSNYKILNRTGFAKIMKKFSKTVEVPCADAYYDARVAPSILVKSKRVEELLKSTEEIYAAYFEHGNRKEALNRLRVREDASTHHFSVFRSGLYLGVALCATVAGLVEAMRPETQRRIPAWAALLRVYGAEFIPTAFALLFGLNLAWWHELRINTVFIFEWDIRHTMDHRQFFEIPSLLMLLLSLCFWVSFLDPFPSAIAPTTWPTVWLVLFGVVLLNPLPILQRASRIWFVRSMLRVFSAGYKRVEFRDFFLGDELNSVAWTLSNLWYFGCEWRHRWHVPDQCAPNSTYWTAVLLSVPAVLRLGQCVRRWVDSDYRTHLHLVNAGKYCSAVLNNFFYLHYRRNGSRTGGDMALWLLFATIYSLWHVGWDLTMDWSLLRPRSRNFLLRDELSFPTPVYYAFMGVDVVLRFVWFIYLLPGSASVTLRSFVAALLEMIRRACWNLLRVENEQIGNTDSFKIVRDLPLPYQPRRGAEQDHDAVEEEDEMHRQGIFATLRLRRLAKKKSDVAEPRIDLAAAGKAGEANEAGNAQRPNPTSSAAPTGAEDRRSEGRETGTSSTGVLDKLRGQLVPDGRRFGPRLSDGAATKGATGRDYTPRDATHGDTESDSDDGA
ncbi:Xenotropic and polytropic retrovirus receptor 1 [Thecaphora frezii]